MRQPRQRPISISRRERDILDQQKKRYEKSTKKKSDWGDFLQTVTLLGLAAAGIYCLVKAQRGSGQSVQITCAKCKGDFLMAVTPGVGRAVGTMCPHCGAELVIDLGT